MRACHAARYECGTQESIYSTVYCTVLYIAYRHRLCMYIRYINAYSCRCGFVIGVSIHLSRTFSPWKVFLTSFVARMDTEFWVKLNRFISRQGRLICMFAKPMHIAELNISCTCLWSFRLSLAAVQGSLIRTNKTCLVNLSTGKISRISECKYIVVTNTKFVLIFIGTKSMLHVELQWKLYYYNLFAL